MIYEDKNFAPVINQDVEETQEEKGEEPSTEDTETAGEEIE